MPDQDASKHPRQKGCPKFGKKQRNMNPETNELEEASRAEGKTHPINRAQKRLWWLLWLVPPGFASASMVGIFYWPMNPTRLEFLFPASYVLDAILVILTGWLQSSLLARARNGQSNRPTQAIRHIVIFSLVQVFVIPVVLMITVLAMVWSD
jgi:hypothetical protein